MVSIDPVFEVWHYEQAERYGLGGRVRVGGLGCIPEDFSAAFAGDEAAYARMLASFIDCARPLVARGADVVIPAGVLPGLLLARERGLASTARRSSIAPRSRSRPPRCGSACTG